MARVFWFLTRCSIRNRLRVDSKLSKHVDQILRRHDQGIRALEFVDRFRKALQVIAGLAAVIVNQCLFSAALSESSRWDWRNQERPVARRKNVHDIGIRQSSPHIAEVQRLPDERAQARDFFHPT